MFLLLKRVTVSTAWAEQPVKEPLNAEEMGIKAATQGPPLHPMRGLQLFVTSAWHSK